MKLNSIKTYYTKCKYCGSENECYEERQIVEKDTRFQKKGDVRIVIHCKKLDEVNRKIEKEFNEFSDSKK